VTFLVSLKVPPLQAREEDFGDESTPVDEGEEGGTTTGSGLPWDGSDRDYTYEELLGEQSTALGNLRIEGLVAGLSHKGLTFSMSECGQFKILQAKGVMANTMKCWGGNTIAWQPQSRDLK
jgi:hypothetical protein